MARKPAAIRVDSRQSGLVFDLPESFRTLSWTRGALWTYYPEDHIGRPTGTAPAFYGTPLVGLEGPLEKPSWPWSQDASEMGSNDFRSTKRNIHKASLSDDKSGLVAQVISNGEQAVRAWIEGDRVRLLVADYDNPGMEGFFWSHANQYRRPLKPGDRISGTVQLRLLPPL